MSEFKIITLHFSMEGTLLRRINAVRFDANSGVELIGCADLECEIERPIKGGEGKVIGCSVRARPVAQLCKLFVDSDYRSEGIGSAIMREAIRQSEEAGCESMGLYSSNPGLDRFYHRLGFILAYIDEDGHRTYVLALDLASAKEGAPK